MNDTLDGNQSNHNDIDEETSNDSSDTSNVVAKFAGLFLDNVVGLLSQLVFLYFLFGVDNIDLNKNLHEEHSDPVTKLGRAPEIDRLSWSDMEWVTHWLLGHLVVIREEVPPVHGMDPIFMTWFHVNLVEKTVVVLSKDEE